MGSGTTTHGRGLLVSFRDLADMFGSWDISGALLFRCPRKPERGGDPSSQRFRPDARAHAAGASAVQRPKVRIQAALPSRPAVTAGDPVRKRCRTAAHTSFRQWGCCMVPGPVVVSNTLRASVPSFQVLFDSVGGQATTRIWHNGELEILTGCETDEVFLLVLKGWRGDETTPPKG